MFLNQARRINLRHIFIIVGLGLTLTIPALLHGVFDSHDLIPFHLKWSKHFAEQFWAGDLYPRWLMGMNGGLGSPTFFFYSPIPYYFTSLFHPLVAGDTFGFNQLILSAGLALIASGITSYLWLKTITDQNSALIGAILYMVWPYHLAIELYWRFAFAEYWSLVWLPLILYFIQKIISGSKISGVALGLSYGLLAMTHLPTFIIFFPITICYAFVIAGRLALKKTLIYIFISTLLGMGLSAIYWLPALTTQNYVSIDYILSGHFFYGNNFLFGGKRILGEILQRYLEVMTILMGGLAYCTFIINRNNSGEKVRLESNYWFVISLISIVMMLPLSKPLWDILPILQKIQFPWRLNTLLTVASTASLALAISTLKKANSFLNPNSITIVILVIMTLSLSILQIVPVQSSIEFYGSSNTVLMIAITAALLVVACRLIKKINSSPDLPLFIGVILLFSMLLTSSIAIKGKLQTPSHNVAQTLAISQDAGEYKPRWVSKEIFNSKIASQLENNLPKVEISQGEGNLLIQQWQARKIRLQVENKTDLVLIINQFYYPGWTAKLKDQSQLIPVEVSQLDGLLRVLIPAGKHDILVTLEAGIEERTGQIISAISAAIAVVLCVWFRQREGGEEYQ